MRHSFRTVLLSALAILVTLLIRGQSAFATEEPNILVIMSDDQGWNDIGYHNPKVVTHIELYNVVNDPTEKKNLAEMMPEKVQELKVDNAS